MELTSAVDRAAVLVGLEGALLVGLGVGYAGVGLVGDPFSRTATVLAGSGAVVAGVLLLAVARAIGRRRGWARSPAVVVQLLALPVGAGLAQGQVWLAAVPVLGLAAGVLYAFATPEARLAFREPR